VVFGRRQAAVQPYVPMIQRGQTEPLVARRLREHGGAAVQLCDLLVAGRGDVGDARLSGELGLHSEQTQLGPRLGKRPPRSEGEPQVLERVGATDRKHQIVPAFELGTVVEDQMVDAG